MCVRCKKEFVDVLMAKAFTEGTLGDLLHEVYEAAYAEGYVDSAHAAEGVRIVTRETEE